MLYNIDLMIVFGKILNDASIAHDPNYKEVIGLAKTIVRHFAVSAENNPLLFVESLFGINQRQGKFCEMVKEVYFDTELLGGDYGVTEYTEREKSKKKKKKKKKSRNDGMIESDSDEDDVSAGSGIEEEGDVVFMSSSEEEGEGEGGGLDVDVDDFERQGMELGVGGKKKGKGEKKNWNDTLDSMLKKAFFEADSIKGGLQRCMGMLEEAGEGENFSRKDVKSRCRNLKLKSNKKKKRERERERTKKVDDNHWDTGREGKEDGSSWGDRGKYISRGKKKKLKLTRKEGESNNDDEDDDDFLGGGGGTKQMLEDDDDDDE